MRGDIPITSPTATTQASASANVPARPRRWRLIEHRADALGQIGTVRHRQRAAISEPMTRVLRARPTDRHKRWPPSIPAPRHHKSVPPPARAYATLSTPGDGTNTRHRLPARGNGSTSRGGARVPAHGRSRAADPPPSNSVRPQAVRWRGAEAASHWPGERFMQQYLDAAVNAGIARDRVNRRLPIPPRKSRPPQRANLPQPHRRPAREKAAIPRSIPPARRQTAKVPPMRSAANERQRRPVPPRPEPLPADPRVQRPDLHCAATTMRTGGATTEATGSASSAPNAAASTAWRTAARLLRANYAPTRPNAAAKVALARIDAAKELLTAIMAPWSVHDSLPFLTNTVDFGFERIELFVCPGRLRDEGCHHLSREPPKKVCKYCCNAVRLATDGGVVAE